MLDQLIHALVRTPNEAADDLLLQALRLGLPHEQRVALDALIRRKTLRGLSGVIRAYSGLQEPLQEQILANIGVFHHALAECGRSSDSAMRVGALQLIAIGRQAKLAYVLSENLHSPDSTHAKAACEAIIALARWVAIETKRLQRGEKEEDAGTRAREDAGKEEARADGGPPSAVPASPRPRVPASSYARLMAERPEIEAAVARALNVHRGKHGAELVRAAMLLADWPRSQTLAILQTPKHGGQGPLLRRLQQPPDSENVAAFLLGATHGQVRSHFGAIFARIEQVPVLDGLLRKTHWLKDAQLQACMHQVTRGTWVGISELRRDADRRGPLEAAAVAEWLACTGLHDIEQDERLRILLDRAKPAATAVGRTDANAPDAVANEDGTNGAATHTVDPVAHSASVAARLSILRLVMRRRRGASVELIRSMLEDPDERIARMAAREVVRRRPPEFENWLLKVMSNASPSVRRVIGRSIGQAGFDSFWNRFDRLDKPTRKQAGRAMLKLLPDAQQRLQRRALSGPLEQRLKALQMVQELGVADAMSEALVQLCSDPNPRLRSKAVSVLGAVPSAPSTLLVERLMNDPDARVRANAVEVLEERSDPQFVPLLSRRAINATGRERANAIKAMHRMRVGDFAGQLSQMLRDERPEHRISALWTLRQIGWWQLLNDVGQLAKSDANVRVRRYAVGVLKSVAELLRERKKAG